MFSKANFVSNKTFTARLLQQTGMVATFVLLCTIATFLRNTNQPPNHSVIIIGRLLWGYYGGYNGDMMEDDGIMMG